ncbi:MULTISPECIES: hypothetical protein [Bartonella]|nr:hypothetical protein [Bartonella choladocola]MBI0141107.1 hypothetical protein [Bartonella choladocola]
MLWTRKEAYAVNEACVLENRIGSARVRGAASLKKTLEQSGGWRAFIVK